MAGPAKPDSKQMALMKEMAARGGPSVEKLVAEQQNFGKQRDGTWGDKDPLAPSKGGGVTETFARAEASPTPLQAPVGGMVNDPAPAPTAPVGRISTQTYVALKQHGEL